jgi:hypothetical protein
MREVIIPKLREIVVGGKNDDDGERKEGIEDTCKMICGGTLVYA